MSVRKDPSKLPRQNAVVGVQRTLSGPSTLRVLNPKLSQVRPPVVEAKGTCQLTTVHQGNEPTPFLKRSLQDVVEEVESSSSELDSPIEVSSSSQEEMEDYPEGEQDAEGEWLQMVTDLSLAYMECRKMREEEMLRSEAGGLPPLLPAESEGN